MAETQVNTYTLNDQSNQQVTALEGGGWVVTWQSNGQDGSAEGVYQQAYDATGAPVGGETRVNTYTYSGQELKQTTALPGGGWAVTWTSQIQDDRIYGVYEQAYDAMGAPVGGETRVNRYTLDHHSNWQTTALTGGGSVYTWIGLYGIYQQFRDPMSAPVGNVMHFADNRQGLRENLKVAALSEGGWIVTWQARDDSGWGVYQDFFPLQVGDDSANVLIGSGDNDYLLGLGGNDTLIAGNGINQLLGGDGDDVLVSETADRTAFHGGDGTDLLMLDRSALGFALIFSIATGSDSLGEYLPFTSIERIHFKGTAFSDNVTGGTLDDTLNGGAGGDKLYGERGNDVLIGGLGADTLNGGTGIDTVSYAASSAGVNVNLATGVVSRGDAAGDVLVSIENVIGSNAANVLTGSTIANVLRGGGGNDKLFGGAGADINRGNTAMTRSPVAQAKISCPAVLALTTSTTMRFPRQARRPRRGTSSWISSHALTTLTCATSTRTAVQLAKQPSSFWPPRAQSSPE